jgi:hypothetical protein
VQGISDLITVHGLINLDFADVKSVMNNSGSALMGIGRATGEDRATEAAREAIDSPLLEVSIDGARGILFNIIGGNDLSMHEINAAAETITTAADPEANIIFGATINPDLEGEVIITVVATGFDDSYYAKRSSDLSGSANAVGLGSSSNTRSDEKTLSEIDMNLDDDQEPVSDFSKEHAMPNIWAIDEEPDESTHVSPKATINSDNDTDTSSNDDDEERGSGLNDSLTIGGDDDLEKPSFLRRLKLRHKDEPDDAKNASKTDKP